MNEFHATIFAWPGVLLDRPPVLITWRGVEYRLQSGCDKL